MRFGVSISKQNGRLIFDSSTRRRPEQWSSEMLPRAARRKKRASGVSMNNFITYGEVSQKRLRSYVFYPKDLCNNGGTIPSTRTTSAWSSGSRKQSGNRAMNLQHPLEKRRRGDTYLVQSSLLDQKSLFRDGQLKSRKVHSSLVIHLMRGCVGERYSKSGAEVLLPLSWVFTGQRARIRQHIHTVILFVWLPVLVMVKTLFVEFCHLSRFRGAIFEGFHPIISLNVRCRRV